MTGWPESARSEASRAQIAVVANAPGRADSVIRTLRAAGFDVRSFSAADQITTGMTEAFDAFVLDVTRIDELSLASLARSGDQVGVPLIVFTTSPELRSGIVALEAGADELLTAAMPAQELLARVRAVLRRRPKRQQPSKPAVLSGGPVVIDTVHQRVEVDGRLVFLTALELRLLSYFLAHPNTPMTREHLLEEVWGYSIGGTDTVTVHVRRLREKIEADPADPMLIRTVWGTGYRFSPTGP